MQPEEQKEKDIHAYDFILDTPEPVEPPLSSRINKRKLTVVLIIISLLLAVFSAVFLTALSRLNKEANETQRAKLTEIAQQQTEISRITELGSERAERSKTRNRLEAIGNNMETSREKILKTVEARGALPTEEELAVKEDIGVTEQLDKADTYQNYDETLDKILDQKLLEYQRLLLAAEGGANQEERQLLQELYKETDAILGLVDQQ